MPDHSPQCAAARQALEEAWNRAPVPHIVLTEKANKAAAKCGCLNQGTRAAIGLSEAR